jgi:cytoskeletal protein CcmA (bactofilin family)
MAAGTAVIGPGMVVIGTIHSEQDLILDGEIDGLLIVDGCKLTIGPHGKATADASASEVDIHGEITGNVVCTGKTLIRSSGKLIGDIRTAGIVIEDGAAFRGKVEIIDPRAKVKSAGAGKA